MTSETFFTSQMAHLSTKIAGSKTLTSKANTADVKNFADFMIAQNGLSPDKTALNSLLTTKVDSKKNGLNVANLFSDSKDIATQVSSDAENFSLDLVTQISDALNLNTQALKAEAEKDPSLAKNLPLDAAKPVSVQDLLKSLIAQAKDGTKGTNSSLQQILATLKKMAADGEPIVLPANLTSDQIAALQKLGLPTKVAFQGTANATSVATDPSTDMKDSKDQNDALTLMLGIVSLLPADQRPQIIVQVDSAASTSTTTAATVATPTGIDQMALAKQSGDMKNILNKLLNNEGPVSEGLPEPDADFKNFLAQASGQKIKNTGLDKQTGGNKTTNNVTDANAAQAAAVDPSADPLGLQSFATTGDDIFSLQNATAAVHVNSMSGMSNSAVQTPVAQQMSPPSQIVAVSLQKHASAGENKNFTLQLDPPELGRVEVRLEFAKDKSIKAHMLVEKPETLAMLQRDGQNLERTLQASGIDTTNSSALSFELASQDHNFGGNNQSSHGHSGANNGTADETTNIEPVMSWHVDPDTGHTHYKLLA